MKVILSGLAILLLVLGLFSMISPIPGGPSFIAADCALLICTSERAARSIQAARTSKSWINKPMAWVEEKIGERLSGPMRRTRPTSNEMQGEE